MPTVVAGSRFPVGSSASRISGRLTNARGDRHPLLLTTGQLGREVVGLLGQTDEVEDLRHLRAHDVLRPADHLERERDVLVDRLVREQLEVLEHATDVAAQLRHLPRAEAADVAARRRGRGRSVATSSRSKQLEERRLPGARRTDEEDELALGDLEGDVTEGDDIALVDLGDVFESNHGKRVIGKRDEGTSGRCARAEQ